MNDTRGGKDAKKHGAWHTGDWRTSQKPELHHRWRSFVHSWHVYVHVRTEARRPAGNHNTRYTGQHIIYFKSFAKPARRIKFPIQWSKRTSRHSPNKSGSCGHKNNQSTKKKAKKQETMSSGNPIFGILWAILLFFIAWPVAGICAAAWILIVSFSHSTFSKRLDCDGENVQDSLRLDLHSCIFCMIEHSER